MKPQTEMMLKVEKVIESCKTIEQLKTAERYLDLAAREFGWTYADYFDIKIPFLNQIVVKKKVLTK